VKAKEHDPRAVEGLGSAATSREQTLQDDSEGNDASELSMKILCIRRRIVDAHSILILKIIAIIFRINNFWNLSQMPILHILLRHLF